MRSNMSIMRRALNHFNFRRSRILHYKTGVSDIRNNKHMMKAYINVAVCHLATLGLQT